MRNIVLDLVHIKAVCCGLNGHLCKSTKSTKVLTDLECILLVDVH